MPRSGLAKFQLRSEKAILIRNATWVKRPVAMIPGKTRNLSIDNFFFGVRIAAYCLLKIFSAIWEIAMNSMKRGRGKRRPLTPF
jgi:hypothetical protein